MPSNWGLGLQQMNFGGTYNQSMTGGEGQGCPQPWSPAVWMASPGAPSSLLLFHHHTHPLRALFGQWPQRRCSRDLTSMAVSATWPMKAPSWRLEQWGSPCVLSRNLVLWILQDFDFQPQATLFSQMIISVTYFRDPVVMPKLTYALTISASLLIRMVARPRGGDSEQGQHGGRWQRDYWIRGQATDASKCILSAVLPLPLIFSYLYPNFMLFSWICVQRRICSNILQVKVRYR